MVQEAHSWPAIGAALQRPYASCYSRYYSALDPVLQEPWSADTVACVEAWVRQGVCWRKIAKDLGIRPVTCKAKWTALRRSEVAVPSSTSAAALSHGGDRSDSPENMDLATVSHQWIESGTETTTTQPVVSKDSSTKWIAFSKEESTAILNLVSKHGSEDWSLILSDFQARFLLQCSTTKSRSQRRMRQRLLDITAQDLSHQYSRIVRTKYHWTFDEETMLIQQVLRHGAETGQWGLIASQLTGIHTAEECRTRWKQLDIPVAQNLSKWSRIEESTFWILWQEFGSDFDRISKLSGGERSPEECQRYFKAKTVGFPDLDKDMNTFRNRVEKLQATLPVARQKYMFTKERSLRLQKAMQLFKRRTTNARTSSPVPSSSWGSWSWVANIVQRGLSATACMDHWYYLRRDMDLIYGPVEKGQTFVTPTTPNSWSHEELKLLDQGVRELGHVWSEIQDRFLPWRSTRSIRQRWLLISNKSVRVTEDEYYTIISAGEKTEQIDYDVLASKLPGWNRSPCRRVFETSYKHILATTVWLPEDDQLLVEKVLETKGRDWNVIAKHFKGVQTARAPLYEEVSKRTDLIRVDDVDTPMRTHKTAWQCRLRWCQLVDPLMPKEWIWSFGGASRILRLSKQLLNDTSTST
ncbi:Myblike DNAbinding domain-containing protein [Dissophora globulifera]|nr:Myblike DNAbinding domain-containing protein [Dissophora globulifera]